MQVCLVCRTQVVKQSFSYFCKKCYRTTLRKLEISNDDFLNYLMTSFNVPLAFPPNWHFRDVHHWIRLCWIPTLKPLAVILESILFLKLMGLNLRSRYREFASCSRPQ